jgi:hypothetical protein
MIRSVCYYFKHMKSAVLLLFLAAFSPVLVADDYIVDVDRQVDFSAIRTFAFRSAAVTVNRPELKNQVVMDGTTAFIRSLLTARGLKEEHGNPDVLVDWEVYGQGFAVNPWGRAIATEVRPRDRLPAGSTQGGAQDTFIEGVLVLDMTARSSGLLIWRGVYRDNESNSAKLARNLQANAKKLLTQYPGKK